MDERVVREKGVSFIPSVEVEDISQEEVIQDGVYRTFSGGDELDLLHRLTVTTGLLEKEDLQNKCLFSQSSLIILESS